MDEIRDVVDVLIAEEETLIEIRGQEQQSSSDLAINSSLIGTLIALTIGVVVGYLVTSGVITPLGHTNEILGELADGKADLNIRVPVETEDELSTLAKSFNHFMSKLQETLGKMNLLAKDVITAATTSQSAVLRTSEAITHQVDEIEDLKNTIDEMCDSVNLVAENALNASEKANEANQNAAEGKVQVEQLGRVIHDLSEDVKSLCRSG